MPAGLSTRRAYNHKPYEEQSCNQFKISGRMPFRATEGVVVVRGVVYSL